MIHCFVHIQFELVCTAAERRTAPYLGLVQFESQLNITSSSYIFYSHRMHLFYLSLVVSSRSLNFCCVTMRWCINNYMSLDVFANVEAKK